MSTRKVREAGNENLLKLAGLLRQRAIMREHKKLPPYDQSIFRHHCGSPGCALGLWAIVNPETWKFQLGEPVRRGMLTYKVSPSCDSAAADFDISADEFTELFGVGGCNTAATEIDAAAYIEYFVAKRRVKANMEGSRDDAAALDT